MLKTYDFCIKYCQIRSRLIESCVIAFKIKVPVFTIRICETNVVLFTTNMLTLWDLIVHLLTDWIVSYRKCSWHCPDEKQGVVDIDQSIPSWWQFKSESVKYVAKWSDRRCCYGRNIELRKGSLHYKKNSTWFEIRHFLHFLIDIKFSHSLDFFHKEVHYGKSRPYNLYRHFKRSNSWTGNY